MLNTELEKFIEEDLGYNDISCTLVPHKVVKSKIIAKEDCILAGVDIAISIFDYFNIEYRISFKNGDFVHKNDTFFELMGDSISMLRCERLVLNFIGHLSAIATMTNKCVKIAQKYSNAKVACTRKTIPGMRKFEKMAVIVGGGDAHRWNLSDCIMIKDNHVKIMGFKNAIIEAKKRASFTQKIEVEVDSEEDALLVAKLGIDILMLDNMSPMQAKKIIETLQKNGLKEHMLIEVSGNINYDNVEEYAKTGADIISMGSLIHAAKWIDVSMDFIID